MQVTDTEITNAAIIMGATVRGMAQFAGLGCIMTDPALNPA